MKTLRVKQEEALVRREKNLADYSGGNLGSLKLPDGADQNDFLKGKATTAEKEVGTLKSKLGKN